MRIPPKYMEVAIEVIWIAFVTALVWGVLSGVIETLMGAGEIPDRGIMDGM